MPGVRAALLSIVEIHADPSWPTMLFAAYDTVGDHGPRQRSSNPQRGEVEPAVAISASMAHPMKLFAMKSTKTTLWSVPY